MVKIQKRTESNISVWFKHLDESLKHGHKPRENMPYVTISRESGAYGNTIAYMLAEYMQKRERRQDAFWAVFDKELMKKVMDENKFPEGYKKYLDESAVPAIQDIVGEILGVHPPHETLVRKISETIFHLAWLGNVILVGQGANIITQRLPRGVHVRLVASLENRVKHMQDIMDISEKEARDYVIKEDRNRHEYIKRYFHKDINDVSLYDIIINLDTVALEDAVRAIGEMVFKGNETL